MSVRPAISAARRIGLRRAADAVLAFAFSVALGASPVRGAVVINEFLADNDGGLTNASGATADWIELYNTGASAVDLSGWYLTDSNSTPTEWRIPDGTTIASNGYLVIFADNSPVSLTNNELHANFGLSNDGEYLGLFLPDGLTVADEYAPAFPPQLGDISYGRASIETELVGAGTPALYRVPNEGDTAPWTNGVGSLGFSSTNGAFTVRYYEMNSTVDNVNEAETMVANSGYWKTDRTYPIVGPYDTVDFHANGSTGYFQNNVLFPGHDYAGQDKEDFVVVAVTAVYIPTAGQWTFCVGSDDGFRLRISGHGQNFVSEYPSPRGFGNTLATFTFPVSGIYDLSLIFFERGGDATLEFSVAEGYQASFSTATFHLTGDPAGGVMHAGAIGSLVETDVGPEMRNINSRLDATWSFTLDTLPEPEDTLTLYVRCADGLRASLNGTPVAALNDPIWLMWNSTATAKRTMEEILEWRPFSVPAALLAAGTNTLAITALNDTVADPDFLIQPRLVLRTAQQQPFFFRTPTPGEANGPYYTAPTPVVAVSEPRGYKTAPFSVSLACTNAGAEIRYTLDGSTPGTNSPLYTAPLSITNTTTLRASVVEPTSVRQNVTTVSWLFLGDILYQGSTPPPGWPASYAVNNHKMEYGMRQAIVTGDLARLRAGMTNAIPSISLVTDLPHLFNAQTGIYVNPGNDGIDWERPVSVELIDPVHGGTNEFQIDGGLRIRGAFSRSSSNPKHSFRLFFRSQYGEGKLRFPLFGDEGASEFDKVDLRCSQNYSWAYENSPQETFIRETFSRDSQRDMGMPYTRSRYYHLYINGQYWGLYQTQERGDADFAETYLGGDNIDWDCIKTSQPGYVTTASDGNFDAFYVLHNAAINYGFSGIYAYLYFRLKGLNADGTRNPSFRIYLDEDNLIVYMLTAYYTGDPDSPVSIWGGMPNNMYGLYNRVTPTGFKWLRHDAEHSLGAHSGYPYTCNTTGAGSNFTAQGDFNPATLHQRLCAHPDYRMRFADLVQKHLYGDGALTPTNAQLRFLSRMNEIDLAIIGESARWGRGKTRDGNWLPTCMSVVNTYLAQRRDIVVSQFRGRGWFPNLGPCAFSVTNAAVPPGEIVQISATNRFYYTTDGSDPRLLGGGINPNAIAVTGTPYQAFLSVTTATVIRARSYDGTSWSPIAETSLTLSHPPQDYTQLRVTELMYAPAPPEAGSPYGTSDFEWIELRNIGTEDLHLDDVRFAAGISHTFAPSVLAPGARLVLARNPAAFATRHATNGITLVAWTAGDLARTGETLSLVTPQTNDILTFTYSNLWYPETCDTGRSLVAVDLAAEEWLWSTPDNWRPSRALMGSPGLPDAPLFVSARITDALLMIMDTLGLEGTAEVWFSDDLQDWTSCPSGVWWLGDSTIYINLQHPSLPAGDRGFFQLRLRD